MFSNFVVFDRRQVDLAEDLKLLVVQTRQSSATVVSTSGGLSDLHVYKWVDAVRLHESNNDSRMQPL